MSKQQAMKNFIAVTNEDRDAAFAAFENQFGVGFVRRGDFNHVWKLYKGDSVAGSGSTDASAVQRAPFSLHVTTGRKESENIDPRIRIPMPTNTAFDIIVSKRNGVQRGTVTMITGESGAGKTTVSTNILTYIKEADPNTKVGFISAEMDQNDWDEECLDNSMLMDLETVFLLDYLGTPYFMDALNAALSRWDCVVVDSFEAILDQIKEETGWTAKKAEAKFIEMLRVNARDHAVAMLVIQQYTKGGTYVGSTKIKHLTTAMAYVLFDNVGDRYLTYTKNRRNGSKIGYRLYFTKNQQTGRIEFDGERLETQLTVAAFSASEKSTLVEESAKFDRIFSGQGTEDAEGSTENAQNAEVAAN